MLAIEAVCRDVRDALRLVFKAPVFAMCFMLILGLGIGGSTAAFSVVRAVLVTPLEYREQAMERPWV